MKKILVIDDEQLTLRVLVSLLSNEGYEVSSAEDGEAGLQSFRENPVDLVITDMTMPDMTGTDLALKILRLRPDMPIVLCTGFSELISEEKAKSLGISLEDLLAGQKAKAKTRAGGKVAAKYANPGNPEQTWTGRGKRPLWVNECLAGGKSLDDLRV